MAISFQVLGHLFKMQIICLGSSELSAIVLFNGANV